MDIARDQFGARLDGVPAAADTVADTVADSGPPDWRGLRVQLAAAYVARQILGLRPLPAGSVSGSFAPSVAYDMAAWHSAADGHAAAPTADPVNLNDKADGKTLGTIAGNSGGEDRPECEGAYDLR
jgi:hypothetical protein